MAANYTGKYARTVLGGAEILVNPGSSGANQWYGIANVASTTVVVSTALVNSTSIILVTPQLLTAGVSGSALAFAVASVNPGGSFSIVAANSAAMTGSYQAAWLLLNPVRNW